jgi:Flp pilus assembly protein TadG
MVHTLRILPLRAYARLRARLAGTVRGDDGVIAISTALFLTTACVMVGFSLDLGNARQTERQAQAGADAAALAGAQQLMTTPVTWSAVVAQVQLYAQANFGLATTSWTGCSDPTALAYTPDLANSDTCISSDSSSSPTEVRVRIPVRNVPTTFGKLAGVNQVAISAAATAKVEIGGPCVVCVLSQTASPALTAKGNGGIVTGGNVIVDSTGDPAASLAGNGNISAAGIGGPGAPADFVASQGATYTPAPVNEPPVPDPLAALPECPTVGSTSPCPTTLPEDADVMATSGTTTLSPGVYGNIKASSSASLTLNPGTYVITQSLSMTGTGNLIANGVTLYFACPEYPSPCTPGEQGGSFSITGSGTLSISPPTSGTFQGLSFFADRNNVGPTGGSNLDGNGGSPESGTIYTKSMPLTLNGNGTSTTISTINSMVIASTLTLTGNGVVAIAYTAAQNAPVQTIDLIQ